MSSKKLKSPFPYFGAKGSVASIILSGLGEISNYVEPFAGSLAVLLANPAIPKIETVNDINCNLANFWRAVSKDPEGVASFADYPIHEVELHARHRWLISPATDEFRSKMDSDPDFYDVKVAGYWVYGMGCSIGNNWLQPKGLNASPLLSSAGGGIHGLTHNVLDWFKLIQERTKRVRVCCGDWSRVVTPSVTYNNTGLNNKDITGVFLDPPYNQSGRYKVYKEDNNIFKQVCNWALANGTNPQLRIVLCGYEGDYEMPDDWQKYKWKTGGGLANLGDSVGKNNASKEIIYFSPYCLKINQESL